MVTTTMRMVDWVHSHTTSTRPAEEFKSRSTTKISQITQGYVLVTLGLELVERTTGLEQRLVDTTSTSYNTYCRTAVTRDGLLGTTGQSDTGLVVIW